MLVTHKKKHDTTTEPKGFRQLITWINYIGYF